jgi:hypothetical protein
MMSLAAEMAMAMRSHEEIFRYWKSLKKRARLPARADLDPARIHRRLPTLSLVDVLEPEPANNPLAFRQRLAGTELFSIYGREITGLNLVDIYGTDEGDYWAHELSEIVASKKPNVGIQSMQWSGSKGLYLFWLRLPLAADGVNVDMVLGHDVYIGRADTGLNSGIRAA